MRVTPAIAAAMLLTFVSTGDAQTAKAEPSSQAYFEFMTARRLEAEGDVKGALAALERASKLDPDSADLHAERAGLYARQNDAADARSAAERALVLDAGNVEAHRILGLVYSAIADTPGEVIPGETPATLRAKAIEHLNAIRRSPEMATDLSLQVTLGRLFLRTDQPAEATTVLEAVVSQAPYAAEPYALLAEARMTQGRVMEAAEALVNAAEINPRYYISLGDLYERQGRWAAAAGAYGQAVENIRTPSRDLRIRWITALINAPDGAGAVKARDAVTDLLKANPNDTRLLYLLSAATREMGDAAASEEAARRILSIDPTSLTGLNALAQSLSGRHAYREVVDLLTPLAKDTTRAKGREAEAASALSELGLAHQQLGQWDQAIGVFTTARTLAPKDATYDLYLAQVLLQARRYDKAEEAARDALRRSPTDERLLRLRAQALSKGGRGPEAITLLEQAIKTESRSPQLALGLADAYAAEKRYDDAVKVVQQAETAFGEDEAFTMKIVGVYEEAGRLPEAERELRRMLERDPLDATALNYLGYMLADRGERLAEAQDLIERALKVDPDNPAYLDSLGWTLFKQGKTDDAGVSLARAAAALPANSVIQDHYAEVLAKQGKWSEAVAAWERALAGDGESIDRTTLDKKLRDARRRK